MIRRKISDIREKENKDTLKKIFSIISLVYFLDDKKDGRTDFPKPEMDVSCLSDGVQVVIHLHQEFDGVLYVKGRSKDEQCRRVVSIPAETEQKTETFKVAFGNCGLIHVNVG